MNVLLIFPPISDPRAPYLAPACLAASLRKEGHEVDLWNMDIEMFLRLLDSESLSLSLKRYKGKRVEINKKKNKEFHDASRRHSLYEVCRTGKDFPNEIGETLDKLRSDEFYNRRALSYY